MLNHINHKMAIYKDCTLAEIMLISAVTLCVLTCVLSCVAKLLLGYFWPGYLLATSLFFFFIKLLLSKLQKLKYGKPYGFYQHRIVRRLSEKGFIRSQFNIRVGRWTVRRFRQ
jgi:conjugative transfer region protein (TIGR03750 family)